MRERALLLLGNKDQLLSLDLAETLKRVHAADRVKILAGTVHLLRLLAR